MIRERIRRSRTYKTIQRYYERYERFLVPGFLLIGFVGDFFTFRTLNTKTAFLLLTFHVVLLGSAIAFMHVYDAHRIVRRFGFRYLRLASDLILQFSFGALLSASLVFYWFSGAFSISWPIMVVFVLLTVFNETFREQFRRIQIQIPVYYFTIFSFATLVLPYLFNSISAWVFFAGGMASLGLVSTYFNGLSRIVPDLRAKRPGIAMSVLFIFAIMNALYFTNIIPPIPLSVREAEVYHNVVRSGSDYLITDEDRSLIQQLLPGRVIHLKEDDRAYIFASIFAPAKLDTTIVHDWQYYDKELKKWVHRSSPSYQISGGREDGYRGFSYSTNVDEGRWRVDIETRRGQVLGRVRFKVKEVDVTPELIQWKY